MQGPKTKMEQGKGEGCGLPDERGRDVDSLPACLRPAGLPPALLHRHLLPGGCHAGLGQGTADAPAVLPLAPPAAAAAAAAAAAGTATFPAAVAAGGAPLPPPLPPPANLDPVPNMLAPYGYLQLVQQLYACHRDAALHHQRGRLNRALHPSR